MQGIVLDLRLSQDLANRILERALQERNLDGKILRLLFKEKTLILVLYARKAFSCFPREKIIISLLLREFYQKGRRCHAVFTCNSALINLLLSLTSPLARKWLPGFDCRIVHQELALSFDLSEGMANVEILEIGLAPGELKLILSIDADDAMVGRLVSWLCKGHGN
ncbi:MAG: hypothetical protein PHW04_04320 [Candidatus Wallbacteria bacterium]|nr:hypothetical protein [Candidatus Wallbacteria bacterium]